MPNKQTMTEEEYLQWERDTSLSLLEDSLPHYNKPTYQFKIGDKVCYGNIKNCVVKEVLEDGKLYGIQGITKSSTREFYQIVPWVKVRPIEYGESDFAQNNDIHIETLNTNLSSILHRYYCSGIDMSPDYQRDYVWEEKDKEALIDSIFKNIKIGEFVLNQRSNKQWTETNYSYEIVDGKQRLNAIVEFYENRFPYKGLYYNDLSSKDQNFFLNRIISLGELKECNRETILKYFILQKKLENG